MLRNSPDYLGYILKHPDGQLLVTIMPPDLTHILPVYVKNMISQP